MRANIVYSTKVKTLILNVIQKVNLFSFSKDVCDKKREDLEQLNELVSLQNRVKTLRLEDKLGKQIFHEDMKRVIEPVTESLEITSQNLTKAITESSIKNNQTIGNWNKKLLEIMDDRGILASFLMSSLSKITIPESTSQFRLVKYSSSNRINDSLIDNSIPITLFDILLTFRETGKELDLKGDVLKMITNKNYNVDLAKLSDKKLLYDFAKKWILM